MKILFLIVVGLIPFFSKNRFKKCNTKPTPVPAADAAAK